MKQKTINQTTTFVKEPVMGPVKTRSLTRMGLESEEHRKGTSMEETGPEIERILKLRKPDRAKYILL